MENPEPPKPSEESSSDAVIKMPPWLVALAAAASATELVVMHKDGPKECDAAHKVRRGDNITMHYIGTIVRSFFWDPFSSQHCTRCFSLLVV